MSRESIPTVILGGSDRRPVELPDEGRDKHPLSGYKGVDVHIGERPLVEILLERLAAVDRFGPIYIVGPAAAYGRIRGASLIDANGTFGENIRVSLELVRSRHPGRPIGFIACDILPEVETLRAMMDDYASHHPCDLWFPLIHAPEDPSALGASSWKPAYRVVPQEGDEAVRVLPGHLAVADPEALRLGFLYRLMQLGYRTRNRSINYRKGVMVRGVILELIYQDLLHLLSLRAPTLTWTVVSTGFAAARELKAGKITRARLERAVRKILVAGRHRRRYPDRRVALPVVDGLSLARDIDTEEEARELGGLFPGRTA